MKKTPNIFDYATSELSQDAFLAWLINWSDIDYKKVDEALNACAVNFVQALLGKDETYQIKTIEVGRQWYNIDVWALVNNEYFIVIEDKKSTGEHSNQLNRYSELVRDYYKNSKIEIKLVYFKMEEQSSYINIKDANFMRFERGKMLSILEKYISKIQNNILIDYYENLKDLDSKIKSYLSLELKDWDNWYSWQGFYTELQKTLNEGEWKYVSNPSGGFLGFWWDWHYSNMDGSSFEFYLQLEQDKMIFKLYVEDPEKRYEIRDFYREHLFKKANELNIKISRFGRIGTWMGVAILDSEYRITNEKGLLNFQATVNNLRKIMHLIEITDKQMNNL